MMLSIFLATFVCVALVLFLTTTKKKDLSDLDKIPAAHFTAPYSRLWLLMIRWRSIENGTRVSLHRKLGPVVRLSPNEVAVDSVEGGIRIIYGSHFDKNEWFERIFLGHGDPWMAIMRGNEEHKVRKKMLSHVYSNSYVLSSRSLDDAITTVTTRLKDELSNYARMGDSVDVLSRTKAASMDITTAWLYGAENGTDTLRDSNARQHYQSLLEHSFTGLFWRCELPLIHSMLQFLGLAPASKTTFAAREKLRNWNIGMTVKASKTAEKGSARTTTVYDCMANNFDLAPATTKDRPVSSDVLQPIPGKDAFAIADELYDHFLASYDGAGIALSYTIYELSRNPSYQVRLRKELHTTLSSPDPQPLSHRIENLPILDAILTETLRHRAPGPGPWPRVVPKGGCRLAGGFDVPAGTVVSSTPWTLHRNETIFPSPEDWRPERWLEADEGHKREMRKWFWTFGSGARMCIGQHYAMRVFKAILVAIYTDFETLIDPDFRGDVEQEDAVIAGPKCNALNVRFRQLA